MLVSQIMMLKKNEIINADPLPDIIIPSDDEVISELAKPYHLTNDQIDFLKKMVLLNLKKFFHLGPC